MNAYGLYGGLADGSLKPTIAKTFPLEEILEAHSYLESNQQFGKIVVTVSSSENDPE